MADLFIAGQFIGVDGITAVANGSQVLYMLTVVIVGLAMGSTVTIGRAVGANRLDNAARAIGNTITLFAGIAIVLTVVLLAGTHGIVVLIGTPAEAVEGTTQYLLICFAGVPFIVAYNIISSIFRGLGDSTSPMVFIAVACACNIALDYLFMGHFQLGPAGAALGTTLAQTISVIAALAAIRHKRTGISLSPTDLKPHRDMLGGILTIGVPTAVQDGCIQIAFIIITVIANYRGLDTAAAVGVVEKVISALFLVPSSMLATVSAVSAQNIGAGKPDRAVKTLAYATAITVTYGIIISIVVELTACPIVGLFTSDATVITLGVQYIRSYIIDAIFAGIHFCFSLLHRLHPQHHRHLTGTRAWSVPRIETFPRHIVPHGHRRTRRLAPIRTHLPRFLRLAQTSRRVFHGPSRIVMLVTILTDMSRQHIIRLDLVAVVFLGGCVGTGLRYALSLIPEAGTFHIGTFTANMIACFAYATLSAWLGGTAAIKGRMKEYVNRGFGMGMCGGLSTMSTLALEEFTLLHGNAIPGAAVYCLATFVAGFALAYAGACLGSGLADRGKGTTR